jgi:hypothetical protein
MVRGTFANIRLKNLLVPGARQHHHALCRAVSR